MDINTNQTPPETQTPATEHSQPAFTPPTQEVATPQKKTKNKLLWLVPLAVVLAAGLLAAGYYLGQQQNNDTQSSAATSEEDTTAKDKNETLDPENTPAPVDPYADWNSSSDIEFPSGNFSPKFSFKYPSSWNHVDTRGALACGIIVSPTATSWTGRDSTVCVGTDGKNDRTLEAAARSHLREQPVASSTQLTVSGNTALQLQSEPKQEGERTVIRIITIADNAKLENEYLDKQNGIDVVTDIGFLHITGEYHGSNGDFEAFKKEYQLIVDSVKLQ